MSFVVPAILMIASGSLHAVVNAVVKGGQSANTDGNLGARMTARASADGVSAIILLPAIFFVPLPDGAWHWLLVSTAIHLVYLYAMIRAYAVADFSATYPIMRGSAPLLTAGVSVGLLGEHASLLQIAGIALVGGSMLTLIAGRHLDRKALTWALSTGAMIALYTVVDAHGVRAAPSVASYIAWNFVLIGSGSVALFAALTRGRVFADLSAQWKPGVSAGSLSVVSYGLALTALSLGPTAPLAALRETGMVTALLIAVIFLKERISPQRTVAVVGIVIGAGAIILG